MIVQLPKLAPPPVPITLGKLLLVEGPTPMHFFEALLRHLSLEKQIEIRSFGGVRDFRTFLTALVSTSDFKQLVRSVGVVRDAEDRPAQAARTAIDNAFVAAGLIPSRSPLIRTTYFILPDDTNPGMIETLCMEAVKRDPSLAGTCSCVDEFFTCLRRNNVALPTDATFAKHHAQAYLATCPSPQMFPGLAAYRGFWPWNSSAFDPIKRFVQSL